MRKYVHYHMHIIKYVSNYQIHTTMYPTKQNFCTQTSCHLMSKTSTAAVYHYTDLSHFFNSHLARIELIEDLIHHLYLSVVVTSTQCAKLSHLSYKSCDTMTMLLLFNQCLGSINYYKLIESNTNYLLLILSNKDKTIYSLLN